MKKLRYSCIALALGVVMTLGSCSKENLKEGGSRPKEDRGEGLLSVKFRVPSGVTKAGYFPETEDEGVERERKVKNVWMLLYDDEFGTNELKYAWNLDVKHDGEDWDWFYGHDVSSGNNTSFITKAKKVEKQDYKLVIIANPGRDHENVVMSQFNNGYYIGSGYNSLSFRPNFSEESELDDGDTWFSLDNFNAVNGANPYMSDIYVNTFHGLDTVDGVQIPAYFFMSNANGLISVKGDDLKESTVEAEKYPFPVHIDRILAKVMVNAKNENSFTTTTGGVVRELKWGLRNVNKKTYMYRNFAPLFDISVGSPFIGVEEDEYNTSPDDREIQYAKDPNYEFGEQDTGHFYTDQTYVSWNVFEDNGWGDMNLAEKNWLYSTENTLSFAAQSSTVTKSRIRDPQHYDEYVTMVKIRAHIDYDFGSLVSPQGYYSYFFWENNREYYKVFTHEQAIEWITAGAAPADFGEDFKYVLGIEPYPYQAEKSSFFSAGASSTEPTMEDCESNWEVHVLPEERDYPCVFYHYDGLNEYDIEIKHFNGPESQDFGSQSSYGYFGVVRNNVYRVNINRIEGPGVPKEDGTYISADVYINPWYMRSQVEDL